MAAETKDELELLNFRIPTSLKRRLQAYGKRRGLSLAAAIRLLLIEAMDREERDPR